MSGVNQALGVFCRNINDNAFGKPHAVNFAVFQHPHASPAIASVGLIRHVASGGGFLGRHQFDGFFKIYNALTQHIDARRQCAEAFGFVFFNFQKLLDKGFEFGKRFVFKVIDYLVTRRFNFGCQTPEAGSRVTRVFRKIDLVHFFTPTNDLAPNLQIRFQVIRHGGTLA